MKEHPILMSAPMVRAILAGRKTQTRRVVRIPVGVAVALRWEIMPNGLYVPIVNEGIAGGYHLVRPYAERGDTLWVRDARALASRLTLTVTEVRVQRLQDISRADARAEGTETLDEYHDHLDHAAAIGVGTGDAEIKVFASLWNTINGRRPGCRWEDNCWVWCVSFKREVTP